MKKILLLLLLLCPLVLQAAPNITVSGNSVTILGSAQTISLTCTLIDPNNTGMLKSGSNVITVFVTSTTTPGNVATCGPLYGNDVILDGFGNANTTYYKVQVFTVANSIVASTPSLQQFYAFTGSGTIDLSTATPLAPSFMSGANGNVTIPGTLTITGVTTPSGGLGGNIAFTGNNTHSGTETFANINNRIFLDQQTGADLCAKLNTVQGLSGSFSIVDASGLTGAQACAGGATLSRNNTTYLFPANMTVTATTGVQVLISGSDIQLLGSGDTTVWDFSSGTSGTAPFLVRNGSTGNSRVRLENFKVIGNRVAGGTAGTLIAASATVGILDRFVARYLTLTNAGAHAILVATASNAEISHNTISSSGLSGIFLDTTGVGHRVLFNTVTDSNLQNSNGNGSIMARDAGTLGNQLDVQIVGNLVKQVTTGLGNAVGIGMNGVKGLVIYGNKIYQTTGSGEGIAFTAVSAKVFGNETDTNAGAPAACGILFYGTAGYNPDSVEIYGNTVKNGSPNLCMSWGANNVTISNVHYWGNRATGNSNFGFQSSSGFTGMTVSNVTIHDNDLTGNVTGPVSLLTAGVTGSYNIWNNLPSPTANPANGTSILGEFASDGVVGTYAVTADRTITAGAGLANIPGLSWTMPANLAVNVAFHCEGSYNETTAATSMQFGIQDVTVAPTNIYAKKVAWTSTAAATSDNTPTLTTTTATSIGAAFTPSAATTVFNFTLDGMIEQPSNASTSVINIMAQFTTNNGTIKRGSYCRVW